LLGLHKVWLVLVEPVKIIVAISEGPMGPGVTPEKHE